MDIVLTMARKRDAKDEQAVIICLSSRDVTLMRLQNPSFHH